MSSPEWRSGRSSVMTLVLAKSLLLTTPVLRPGDTLIYDRGLLDSTLLSRLKRDRQVEVIVPVKENMALLEEAQSLAALREAESQGQGTSIWRAHPWRQGEEITLVQQLSHVWEGCEVEINGALVRFLQKDQTFGYVLLVCTNLRLSAPQILKTYRLRVEIEEDNKQIKHSWELGDFTTTDRVGVIPRIVMVLAAYRLFAFYNGTKQGRQFSRKTIQQAKRHEADSKNIRLILVAWGCFVLLKPAELVLWMLKLPQPAREKLIPRFEEWVKDTSDLWPFEFS